MPVELVRVGAMRVSEAGETRNVSSGGVLLSNPGAPVEVGQPIEYLITLPSGDRGGDIRLRCMGKIVRLDESHHYMAATLERYEFIRVRRAAR